MTFKDLQDDLIVEIENVLEDIVTKDKYGNRVVGVKGFAHRLPIIEEDEEDPDRFFPYFIVRHDTMNTQDDEDCWHVSVNIIIGVYERAVYLGHEHLLIIIQRILDRFVSDPKLSYYRADQNMTGAVAEDDTYPYYFGAVGITFSVPKMGREAKYYV